MPGESTPPGRLDRGFEIGEQVIAELAVGGAAQQLQFRLKGIHHAREGGVGASRDGLDRVLDGAEHEHLAIGVELLEGLQIGGVAAGGGERREEGRDHLEHHAQVVELEHLQAGVQRGAGGIGHRGAEAAAQHAEGGSTEGGHGTVALGPETRRDDAAGSLDIGFKLGEVLVAELAGRRRLHDLGEGGVRRDHPRKTGLQPGRHGTDRFLDGLEDEHLAGLLQRGEACRGLEIRRQLLRFITSTRRRVCSRTIHERKSG